MGEWSKARIQLCGRFAVDVDGSRIEDRLPGRRGRVVFAYLVLNRGRALPREELLVAGWGGDGVGRGAVEGGIGRLGHQPSPVIGSGVAPSWVGDTA